MAATSVPYPTVTTSPMISYGYWPGYNPVWPLRDGYLGSVTTSAQYIPAMGGPLSTSAQAPNLPPLISQSFQPIPANPYNSVPGQTQIPLSSLSSFPGDVPRGHYGHKSLPVSKWKLEKYAGSDQGLKLNEFLVLVSQLALSERTSEAELFDSAFHLFSGPALSWYMTMRSAGRLASWPHLVSELRRTFAHPELDSLVRAKIYQRRQQRNETFQDYYYDMERMFRSMILPMSDVEQLDILKRNMRSDYKKSLLWKPIFSLPELLEAGHIIDASNFSLFAQVFEKEKTTNAVSEFKPGKGDSRNPDRRSPFKSSQKEANNNKAKEGFSKRKGGSDGRKSTNPSGLTKELDPKEGPSKPTRTLETLIEAHRPPRSYECLYCRQPSHSLEQCRNYRGSICLVCGFKEFETHNCPYCIKNGLQTAQNRRPSSPLA